MHDPRYPASLHARAVRVLLLGCVLWGLSFPTAKALEKVQSLVLPGADSWFLTGTTMAVRFGLATLGVLLMLCWQRALKGFTREEFGQGIGLGLFGGLGMLFQLDGLAHTEASTSAFLTQATVIFVPLVKAWIDRTLPSVRVVFCCMLALAGVALLSGMDWQQLKIRRGEAETLMAAFFFTGHILWLDRSRYMLNHFLRVSLIMFTVISVVSLPLALSSSRSISEIASVFASPMAGLFMALLVGPCTLLAFLWMNRWQRHVSATTAGLIYCLEPVFATLLAFFLPAAYSWMAGIQYANETLHLTMAIGGSLILVANVLMLGSPVKD